MWNFKGTFLSLIHRPQQAPEPLQIPKQGVKGRDAQTLSPEKGILGAGLRHRPDIELQVGTALELSPSSPPILHPPRILCVLLSFLSTLLITSSLCRSGRQKSSTILEKKCQEEIVFDPRILVRSIIHLTNMYLVTGYGILKDRKWKPMGLERISGNEINISASTFAPLCLMYCTSHYVLQLQPYDGNILWPVIFIYTHITLYLLIYQWTPRWMLFS